jgi:hypothetical protein
VSRVAWLAFPTDFLSRETKREAKKILWIEAAPEGGATYLEIGFTAEPKKMALSLLEKRVERKLFRYVDLPNGNALIITYYHADWQNEDLKSPASNESIFPDLLFSSNDPDGTGRPIRIVIETLSENGNELIVKELGGYKINSSAPNKLHLY